MNIHNKGKNLGSIKQKLSVLMLIPLLLFTMTGCQMVKETFGKEYRMIDEFFEQMEADLIFSCQEYYDKNGISGDASTNAAVELAIERFDEQKAAWKEELRLYGGGNTSELESAMADAREQLREELAEADIELKSTTVERDLIGSVWHFVRNHWLISLIILGAISSLGEFVSDKLNERKKKKNDEESLQ